MTQTNQNERDARNNSLSVASNDECHWHFTSARWLGLSANLGRVCFVTYSKSSVLWDVWLMSLFVSADSWYEGTSSRSHRILVVVDSKTSSFLTSTFLWFVFSWSPHWHTLPRLWYFLWISTSSLLGSLTAGRSSQLAGGLNHDRTMWTLHNTVSKFKTNVNVK